MRVWNRECWSCGVLKPWQNQRAIRDSERHREKGKAMFGNPICPPPCGAPPLGCTTEYRAMGRGERWHTPASHVRLNGLWLMGSQHNNNLSYVSALPSYHISNSVCYRCIQDPEIIVTVSQIMSVQYTPPEVSEDCLYLNVYTPAEATKGDKLPVGWYRYTGHNYMV